MKVLCPACARPVPGADIDLVQRVALCRPCGELIPLMGGVETLAQGTGALVPFEGAATSLATLPASVRPTDLVWNETTSDERFVGRARTGSVARALPVLFFATFWNGFLLFWYALALSRPGPVVLLPVIFPLLHVAIGAFVTYRGLAMAFNRGEVRMDRERFSSGQRPFPARRPVEEATANIAEFTVTTSAFQVRVNGAPAVPTWTVHVLTRDDRATDLGFHLPTAQHARFVADRLNTALQTLREPRTYRG